jgi:hypothetical protein
MKFFPNIKIKPIGWFLSAKFLPGLVPPVRFSLIKPSFLPLVAENTLILQKLFLPPIKTFPKHLWLNMKYQKIESERYCYKIYRKLVCCVDRGRQALQLQA